MGDASRSAGVVFLRGELWWAVLVIARPVSGMWGSMYSVRLRRLAWVIFCLSAAVIAFAVVLGFGVIERQLVANGPFQSEAGSAGSHALVVDLRPALPFRRVFSSGGDSKNYPYGSTLRAWINDVQLDSPHSAHDLIRLRGGGTFSHWGEHLIFSLPQGVPNSAAVKLEVHFALKLHYLITRVALCIAAASGMLLLWQFRRRDPTSFTERFARYVTVLGNGLRVLQGIAFAAAFVFLCSMVVGWWSDFALPNTAIFRWWPTIQDLGLREPFAGHALLLFSMIGVGTAWVASLIGRGNAFAEIEGRLTSDFRRFGLFLVVGLYLFSVGATWAGIPRPQDLNGNAIAGLLPFNDANGHFQHIYLQAMEGAWHPFVARRPLAAALRTVAVAGVDYNNFHFLMLQAGALAVATFFAARAVADWRGIWAGLTFLGLTHILLRPYLPTNLTEPLGLLCALVSIPFLVRAIRHGRLGDTAIGFHLTLWALMIRMGGMFTLPAMAAWAVLREWPARARIVRALFVVILVVVANFALVTGLSKLYGTTDGALGSNFSHTICGLTHGTDWTGCGKIYADELKAFATEAGQAHLFYTKAGEMLTQRPGIFFGRLLEGGEYFFLQIWRSMLIGYTGTLPDFFPLTFWWIFAACGLIWVLRSRQEKHERSFWALFVLGLTVSAPFVIFDDGWRVLCASFPLLFVLIASGFTSPVSNALAQGQARQEVTTGWRHYFVLASIAGLCLVVPNIVYRTDWLGRRQLPQLELGQGEDIFLGTRRMSGFVVMPDGEELPHNVPAIHHAAFVQIVRYSGIEQYEPLVTPTPIDRPPFAIVSAIPVNRKTSGLLILPAEVFSALDDRPWLFRFTGGGVWPRVVEARPLAENGH